MKTIHFSFLFLYFTVAAIKAQPPAQVQKDSITYHYQNILNPENSTDIPNAIKFYTSLKEQHLKKHKIYKAIEDLRLIAIGQNNIGNIYDSESATVEALKLIDNSPQSDTLIESRKGLYNQLGKIYRNTLHFDKAIEAYNNALKYSKRQKDSITVHNNKATIYKDLKLYNKALSQLTIALNKDSCKQNLKLYAMVLDNFGFVQSKLKIPEALSNLMKALQIREELSDLSGIYSSYKNLTIYYFDKGDKSQAINYANKAYQSAVTLNSITNLQDALSLFAIMNEDPKIVQFKKLTDSIANQKQLAENKNAFIKYNVEKEQKNTAEAQLEQEKERGQKLLYMALVIFASVLSICIILLLRVRHKREKIIQVHNTESRISKKVHDEVANDVYQLMAKIQGNNPDNEKLLDDLEKIYNKTRDISKENSAIEIEANFSEQLNDLLLNYQNEKVSIVTRNINKIEWESISEIKKTTIFRVLQELMTNMKKYSEASAVVLLFQQTNKNITIKYTDNGIGCTLKNKNGLQNAENRIHAINGTITFESEPGKGFRSKISI